MTHSRSQNRECQGEMNTSSVLPWLLLRNILILMMKWHPKLVPDDLSKKHVFILYKLVLQFKWVYLLCRLISADVFGCLR